MQGLELEGKTSINSQSDEWLAVSFEYFLLQMFNILFPRAYAREQNEEIFSLEHWHLQNTAGMAMGGQQSCGSCMCSTQVMKKKSMNATRLRSWHRPDNNAMCFAGQSGRCDVPSWQLLVT